MMTNQNASYGRMIPEYSPLRLKRHKTCNRWCKSLILKQNVQIKFATVPNDFIARH